MFGTADIVVCRFIPGLSEPSIAQAKGEGADAIVHAGERRGFIRHQDQFCTGERSLFQAPA